MELISLKQKFIPNEELKDFSSDNMRGPYGKLRRDVMRMLQRQPVGKTLVIYPSRKDRDRLNAKHFKLLGLAFFSMFKRQQMPFKVKMDVRRGFIAFPAITTTKETKHEKNR